MANNSKSYLSQLLKDDKSKNKAAMETAAAKASLQLQSDLLALRGRVADAAAEVDAARYAVPFNSANLINAKSNLAEAEENLAMLEGEKEFHSIS